MINLFDPVEREIFIAQILFKDAHLSTNFAYYSRQLINPDNYQTTIQLLEFSCNGLVWIIGLIAMSYFTTSNEMIEMEVNLLIALIMDISCVLCLKAFTERQRPMAHDPLGIALSPNSFSFPSGYATRATLIFMFFIFLHPISILYWIPLYVWWFCLCITRIMLRKHHILDVLAGIVIGFLESIIVWIGWIDQETSLSIFNWISEEKTASNDADM